MLHSTCRRLVPCTAAGISARTSGWISGPPSQPHLAVSRTSPSCAPRRAITTSTGDGGVTGERRLIASVLSLAGLLASIILVFFTAWSCLHEEGTFAVYCGNASAHGYG